MGKEWKIGGDYFETCNCDFICPCIITNMEAAPTHGTCKANLAFAIRDGHFGDLSLQDLKFIVVVFSEGPMGDGDWTVGLIVDEDASDEQVEAIGAICSGEVGGPMENAAALVSQFAGISRAKIEIDATNMSFNLRAAELVASGAEMTPAIFDSEQPIYIDNAGHPANTRLAIGKATHTQINVFGIEWENADGGNNGHMAPFAWEGTA